MDNIQKPVWTITQAYDAITMNPELGKAKRECTYAGMNMVQCIL